MKLRTSLMLFNFYGCIACTTVAIHLIMIDFPPAGVLILGFSAGFSAYAFLDGWFNG